MEYPLPIKYDSLHWAERKKVRKQYCELQEGKCWQCGGDLDSPPVGMASKSKINWRLFPANFNKYPVHLHHDRKTRLTVGAVHSRCNAYLWEYKGE